MLGSEQFEICVFILELIHEPIQNRRMTLNNELLAEVIVFWDVLPMGPFLVLWVEATVMALE